MRGKIMDNLKTYLITGGAGYIGTNIIAKLINENAIIVVVDDFSNSHKTHINSLIKKYKNKIILINGNFGDSNLLDQIFKKYAISVVVHLAAKKYIPESFKVPEVYERVNVNYTKNLLETMEKFGVKKIVFPSSISVYGNAIHSPTNEDEELKPMSKYAQTKIAGENLIKDWAMRTLSDYVILRLSNPIGANVEENLGDHSTNTFTNLTTELYRALESDAEISLNGNDHPTKDGTAVRDFVDVKDIAAAFISAIKSSESGTFNIGYGGNGFSVLDIILELEKISGKKLNYKFGPKREGDCSKFISDISRANKAFGFKPNYNLNEMVWGSYKFFVENIYQAN